MKVSQKVFVLNQLKREGSIRRNECLQLYISRLGAIICDLKKEGYEIEGRNLKTEYGTDYIYTMERKQDNLF